MSGDREEFDRAAQGQVVNGHGLAGVPIFAPRVREHAKRTDLPDRKKLSHRHTFPAPVKGLAICRMRANSRALGAASVVRLHEKQILPLKATNTPQWVSR